jgi:2-polyprenyl-3-methyl-5-hydroxy-6-metoxy-1,4-benzoquinol methylase
MAVTPVSPELLPESPLIDQLNVSMYQVDIFKAAIELELWAKVAAGLGTAEELAEAEGWDLGGTRMLLDDICTLKLLTREGGRHRLPPEAEAYLLPGKPTYLGRFLVSEYGWEGDGKLAEAIRTGKRPIGYTATKPESIDTWIAVYARSWACPETYLEGCDAIWEAVGINARDGLHVLDVACGPAPKTLSLARHHSGVQLTLLDWEPILETARKVAARLGIAERVTLLPGDLWSVPYPSAKYDVVYLGFIAHFLSPEENTRLFRKAFDALVAGGAIVVNSIRREYPNPTAPELWFYAVSVGGGAYDFHEYRQMLEGAGFRSVVDVSTQPIKALKP